MQTVRSQNRFPRNFDENKIPPYELPDILIANDGTTISTPELWETKRRPEIVELLESNLFGRPPEEIDGFESKLVSSKRDGSMLIQQVILTLRKGQRNLDLDLLIFLPAEAKGPVPTIIAMNFKGNHTVIKHPSVIAKNPRSELIGRKSRPDQLDKRGAYADRFPIQEIVSRGWGLITYAREDVIVDSQTPDFEHGAFGLFPGERQPDHWGLMAAWAWSISRVIDYVETNPAFASLKLVSETKVIEAPMNVAPKTAKPATRKEKAKSKKTKAAAIALDSHDKQKLSSLDDLLKEVELAPFYETTFDRPLRIVEEETLLEDGKIARELPTGTDWVLEVTAEASVKEGRLHLKNNSDHCVLWNTREMPESFVAEWDFQHHAPTGTAIIFFAAQANNGAASSQSGCTSEADDSATIHAARLPAITHPTLRRTNKAFHADQLISKRMARKSKSVSWEAVQRRSMARPIRRTAFDWPS